MSARRLLVILGGALGVLLAAFTAWGPGHGVATTPHRVPASPAAVKGAQAAARYAPRNVVVTRARGKGELIVSWSMPIRPDVVATVIYQGSGAARARTVVNYGADPRAVPQAILRGLPGGQEVCLSAAHLVWLDGSITNAVSRPLCAVPR